MKNPFRRKPKTDEQQAIEAVREKTENYVPKKKQRFIQSSTRFVYGKDGQIINVITVPAEVQV
jgi:hypothetical protein